MFLKIWIFWNITSSKSTTGQSFERRRVTCQKRRVGGTTLVEFEEQHRRRAPPPETPPPERALQRAPVSEGNWSKKRQEY